MITAESRRLYADQVRAQGPAYANLAGAIEAGAHDHSFWCRPALLAIGHALRYGAPDVDEVTQWQSRQR